VLEGANSKLGALATDILGKSGRDMLEAILAGRGEASTLAELARGRVRAKLPREASARSLRSYGRRSTGACRHSSAS
jgi:hypothetical protein